MYTYNLDDGLRKWKALFERKKNEREREGFFLSRSCTYIRYGFIRTTFLLTLEKFGDHVFYDFWIVNNVAVKNLGSFESIPSGPCRGSDLPLQAFPLPCRCLDCHSTPGIGAPERRTEIEIDNLLIPALPDLKITARLCGRHWGFYFGPYKTILSVFCWLTTSTYRTYKGQRHVKGRSSIP